jgi:hypothetical protein
LRSVYSSLLSTKIHRRTFLEQQFFIPLTNYDEDLDIRGGYANEQRWRSAS